ncbi:MAG TPA: Gfo/Idh/MocA family oxidoreductase [Sedimentisphaerales bacterium]|nr:Gfo/Idh/MocA family oxidoreductase [Sedimentisphaerales bacterium]
MDTNREHAGLDRRRFLKSTAGAGAAMAFGVRVLHGASEGGSVEPINVALIGAGAQGEVLMTACLKIPGVRFQAVCDIWEAYNQGRASRLLQRYGHPARPYVDCDEMLAKETGLQAAIIATPDFWHAPHTVACLNAGLHVYCEKLMSNTVDGARQMVEASRRAGKLLQIGHQRRSNPRYLFCRDTLLRDKKLLGRITAVNGQWNRAVQTPLGWPKGKEIDAAILKRYGYGSMDDLRNWRWRRGLGGGPIVDLGAHQIDVFNWFLDARPQSVLASGRLNYYDKGSHQWYDTVMAVYEYDGAQGPVTAFYQTLSANGHQQYFEKFLGDRGTLAMSERSDLTRLYPEPSDSPATAWAQCVKEGHLTAQPEWLKLIERMNLEELAKALTVSGSVNTTGKAPTLELAMELNKPIHQPHLENFFDAIRGQAQLNCPAEVGYAGTVTVLKVNEAIDAGRRLEFRAEDFRA